MGFIKSGLSAIGKLFMVTALAGTFLVGLVSVVYLSLKGEEVEIPKIVGKNVNDGEDELANLGLRIKKIAYRYSNEKPNTILEQRPRAGENAKSGLMVFVVVSQENPDGNEAPVDLADKEKKEKDEAEDIKELPELETEKSKKTKSKKTDKKKSAKTRDVIKEDKKEEDQKTETEDVKKPATSDVTQTAGEKTTEKTDPVKKETEKGKKTNPTPNPKKSAKPDSKKGKKPVTKPKTSGDTRTRKVPPSN